MIYFARFGYACITRVNSRRCNDCELHKGRSGEPAYCCRPPAKSANRWCYSWKRKSNHTFESAYDEHAHRLAKLYENVGG